MQAQAATIHSVWSAAQDHAPRPAWTVSLALLDQRRELLQHLIVLGEAADCFLAEDQLAVRDDLENAAAAGNQLRLDLKLLLNGVRQTGGSGQVVSLRAVGDGNLHDASCAAVFRPVRP